MTKKSFLDNYQRVCDFYKITLPGKMILQDEEPCHSLVTMYGHILDLCGAPNDGVSILFLPTDDYKELLTYAKSNYTAFFETNAYSKEDVKRITSVHPEISNNLPRANFRFTNNGYKWGVTEIN